MDLAPKELICLKHLLCSNQTVLMLSAVLVLNLTVMSIMFLSKVKPVLFDCAGANR